MSRAVRHSLGIIALILSACTPRFDVANDGEFIVLSNGRNIEVSIAPQRGGELTGLRVNFQDQWHELIYRARDYSGKPGFRGKAQPLWPATGRVVTPGGKMNHYELGGATYAMPMHGFASSGDWRVVSTDMTASSAVALLEMTDTEESRHIYPFAFKLQVEYRVSGTTLDITYRVIADGQNEQAMPFSIGNHMGFNMPLIAGSSREAMRLDSNLTQQFLTNELSLYEGITQPSPYTGEHAVADIPRRMPVSLGGADETPTLTIFDPAGYALEISHQVLEGPAVESVDFNFWTDLQEGYLSPEPWVGTQNSLNSGLGLNQLDPGEQWEWRITLHPKESTPASATVDRPNVVVIFVDDLGANDVAYAGSTFYETPAIDRLAAESMRFDAAYSASPVCSPTRASLMTGLAPERVRITDWIPGVDPKNRPLLGPSDLDELPLSQVTIAERFRAAGYRTFYAGKWHLGGEGFHPEQQGFHINKGGHHKGSPPGGYYSPYNNPKLADGPSGEYLTDRLTDETIDFITNHRDQPFFAFLSYYTVHTPLQASRRHIDHYSEKAAQLTDAGGTSHIRERNAWVRQRQDDAVYASMVAALDENVGRLMAKLDELGLGDDTIVVFTSDNGGLSAFGGKNGRKKGGTSNLPLRAGKGWLYEGGIRVPLLIRAPGVTAAGTARGQPVVSTDLVPTLLELAGIDAQGAVFDGKNLVPLLKGGDLDRDAIYFYFPHYHASGSVPSAAVRAGDWKLVHFFETGTSELYRLNDDPGETTDLAQAVPDKAAALEGQLFRWLDSVDAQMPVRNMGHQARQ